jgi:putative ABC transport system permease protein
MKLLTLAAREMTRRKARLAACILAPALAVALLVGVDALSRSAERAVASRLEALGADLIALPRGLRLFDYYRGEFGDALLSEDVVRAAREIGGPRILRVSPRLSGKATLNGQAALITGIVPGEAANPGWASDALEDAGIVLGHCLAERLDSARGDSMVLNDRMLEVVSILPETGGPDDARAFLRLHVAQDLLGTGRAINEVGIVTAAGSGARFAEELRRALPAARIVSVEAVGQAQRAATAAMHRYAWMLMPILLIAVGAGIATHTMVNVRERRGEIGTYLAMGASPGTVLHLFTAKAVILGVIGGVVGYALGTALSISLGPSVVAVEVSPSPFALAWGVLLATALTVFFSFLPARAAAQADPADVMREA